MDGQRSGHIAALELLSEDGTMDRRQFLKITSLGAVGVAVGSGTSLLTAGPAQASVAQWTGHQPGRIYLGFSTQQPLSDTLRMTGPVGLRRTYYRWGDASRESRNILSDHAADRIPWISFKPPSTTAGGWAAVASGAYDADIRARARRYAGHARPVIATFNHEPHNDKTGTAAEFARAWIRIHDVMRRETGLRNVALVPIIGDWVYNPKNPGVDADEYITAGVLDRCAFLGLDLYQNQSGQGYAERLGRVLAWLDHRGHPTKMLGLGETGCTDDYGSPTGAQWWSASWKWAVTNRSRVAAISYFHSLHNNNSGNDWRLNESQSKLDAYKRSLGSATACTL